uniref:Programmed cell death 7 n=1 Tax=Athene cunicularia TaxID=194338 RepID=A0A663N0K5_ATHCN
MQPRRRRRPGQPSGKPRSTSGGPSASRRWRRRTGYGPILAAVSPPGNSCASLWGSGQRVRAGGRPAGNGLAAGCACPMAPGLGPRGSVGAAWVLRGFGLLGDTLFPRPERELKAAADSVLSEVRKKQADTKRMVDILRALEKLRKLRKEAAGRKGVCPPPSADEAFESQVESLKTLLKNRTELYEAEERALRVMLEGEQEEERKREMEKKQKKEREKLLQQKLEIDSKLFGEPDEFPLAHLLQPFREYYLQAEHSVAALIQIRHEWDQYLVPADHPEGSCIPPGWVLPSLPTNDTWATAVR